MTTPDLYAVLGLDREADLAAIRRAYRQKAKAAHPDAGGTVKKFALITLAVETLGDEKRRRHYDETGEAEERPVDNHQAQILEMISGALHNCVMSAFKAGSSPEKFDLVEAVATTLAEQIERALKTIEDVKKTIEINKTLRDRFSRKEGANVFHRIIDARTDMLVREIAKAHEKIATMREAIEEVKNHGFAVDKVEPTIVTMQSFVINMTGTGTR